MKKKIVIFGASKGGERALSILKKKYCVIAFSDNNSSLHGGKLKSIPIVAPEKIHDLNPDLIYIASQYSLVISIQLTCDIGWDSNKLEVVNRKVLTHHSGFSWFWLTFSLLICGLTLLFVMF